MTFDFHINPLKSLTQFIWKNFTVFLNAISIAQHVGMKTRFSRLFLHISVNKSTQRSRSLTLSAETITYILDRKTLQHTPNKITVVEYGKVYGFVKGRNTTDAMIDFATKAINAFDENVKAVGVFLDLQKAFDCFNYKILLNVIDFKLIRLANTCVVLTTILKYLYFKIVVHA